MTKWQCVQCGYFFDGTRPPEPCPGCKSACSYTDVTCYRPECGGPVNADPMLLGMITKRTGLAAPLRPSQTAAPQEVVYAEKVSKEILFQGLSEKEIQQVLATGEIKTYEPGDVVFKEGAESVHIYIVEQGKLAVLAPEGKTAYLASDGDVLGWSSLMLPYKRTASANALEKSRVVVIDHTKLQDFCAQNPSIGYKITQNVGRIMAARMRTAKAMSVDLVYG
ncbi:MAG: cyclic nucleotide-binding domain-containing protein [Chloroflexi bacterium]|nr:cyclic nucleotide-binding domain-containing protein [Chloroflexota bacterium]